MFIDIAYWLRHIFPRWFFFFNEKLLGIWLENNKKLLRENGNIYFFFFNGNICRYKLIKSSVN